MKICFDMDGTICVGYPYQEAKPLKGMIDLIATLKEKGHTIIIQTARGMGRNSSNAGAAMKDTALLTLTQLENWGVDYDEIYFGKPNADIYIDDKGYNISRIGCIIDYVNNFEKAEKNINEKTSSIENKLKSLLTKLDEC